MAAPATVYGEFAFKVTTEAQALGRSNGNVEPEPVYLPHIGYNSKSSGEMTSEKNEYSNKNRLLGLHKG